MSVLLERLKPKERRGSKPRCHILTHGSPDAVAARLSPLATPFSSVAPSDHWMPQGFADVEEAQLHKAPRLLSPGLSSRLGEWWLPSDRQLSMTPNFDIASTCTIEGAPGLLLIEAKAHQTELMKETCGRQFIPWEVWNRRWSVDGVPLIPLIRSLEVPLERESGS